MLSRVYAIAFLFLCALTLCPSPLAAQQPPDAALGAAPEKRGTLSGIIHTQQGVPVPGATVSITADSSTQNSVTWTDAAGAFQIPGLLAGRYHLQASQLGFDTVSLDVQIGADAKPQPLDLTLHPAALAASPAVPFAANPAATKQADARPASANSGNASSSNAGAQNRRGAGAAPGGGGRGGQVNPDLLGTLAGGGAAAAPPTPDPGASGDISSSDAFVMSGTVGRATTAGSDFSYGSENSAGPGRGPGGGGRGGAGGFGPGAQGGGGPQTDAPGGGFGQGPPPVAMTQRMLRLGANKLRLSFYERYGNSEGDAKPDSLTGASSPKIAYYRQRFGITLGGPLTIPKIYNGRDKTFFFVNYENARNRTPIDSFSTVPTLPERMGDFSATGTQLFDPASSSSGPRAPLCLPAPCSVIPPARLDQAALGLLQFIPPPTDLTTAVQNYHLQAREPDRTDRLSVRALHTISPKLNFSAFYNLSSSRPDTLVNFPAFLSRQSVLGQILALGLTQNWTPKLINDSRITFTRNRSQLLNRFAFTQDTAAQLGITGVSTDPINFGVPQIGFTNFSDLSDPVPSLRRNQTFRVADSTSWNLTKHTIHAGLELARMENNNRVDPVARGSFSFTGLLTSQLDTNGNPVTGTGIDFADFLLGLPEATTVRFGSSSSYLRSWGFNGFISDDWRIHPRFTLTYGLRYDVVTPPIDLFNNLANLDLNVSITALATVLPGAVPATCSTCFTAAASPFHGALPQSLIRADYNKWAPRLALAWRPKSKITAKRSMTVRAGYSIFYNNSIYNQLDAAIVNQPPFSQAQTLLSSTTPGLTLENGFPPVLPGSVPNTVGVDPNYRIAYTQIWNFATEMQMTPNVLLELTYTGTKGTHLDLLRSPNRVFPGTTTPRIPNAPTFTYDTFGASSIYHALQVRIQKRMTQGLMIQGVYTFAKSLDNASSIGGGGQVVVQDDNNFNAERGLSSFDIRHQFRLNYVYEFPFGERKRWLNHGWQGRLFNSWTLSGFTTLASGTPSTARVLGSAANSSGTGTTFSGRADQIGDPNLPSGQRTPLHFFNTAAFALPPPGQFGDAARNSIPGPGVVQFNMALAKAMQFGKDGQRRLDARLETQNLFNHPNFLGLNTVVNSTTFGRVQSAKSMRQLDLSLRWRF